VVDEEAHLYKKQYRAFGRGTVQFLVCENPKILSFVREYDDETIFVILNLSKNPQSAELNLSKYSGYTPRDVFGGIFFPTIAESNYRLTFGPHGYYVFTLSKPQAALPKEVPAIPEIRSSAGFRISSPESQESSSSCKYFRTT